jgi:hypothetical protein
MAREKRKRPGYSDEFRARMAAKCRERNARSKADLEAGYIARYPGGRKKLYKNMSAEERYIYDKQHPPIPPEDHSPRRAEESKPRPESADQALARLRRQHSLPPDEPLALKRGADGVWVLGSSVPNASGSHLVSVSNVNSLNILRRQAATDISDEQKIKSRSSLGGIR